MSTIRHEFKAADVLCTMFIQLYALYYYKVTMAREQSLVLAARATEMPRLVFAIFHTETSKHTHRRSRS